MAWRHFILGIVLILGGGAVLLFFARPMPSITPADYGDADLYAISPSGAYVALLTSATWSPESAVPPKSTLFIFDTETKVQLGAWQLSPREYWLADPDMPLTDEGEWREDAHCYRHTVWSGNYTPGEPVTTSAQRDFCF